MTKEMTKEMAIHNLYALKQRTRALSNHEALDMAIKALEQTELKPSYNGVKSELEQTRWIPVTEDAPPKGTICLWCNKHGGVFISEITYRTERISYVGKHGYFSNGLENYGNIVAWQPLPQPYKAEKEDKE